MTSTTASLSFLLLFASFGPCSEPPSARPESATAEKAAAPQTTADRGRELPPQQTKTSKSFMREHASEALAIRNAIIGGRLDELHRVSATVASDEWSPQLRPDYLAHVNAVRAAARVALDSQTLSGAATALGQLGDACATCHREQGGPPQPALVEAAAAGDDSMAAHAAAEKALWEGLITPSQATWMRGAQGLVNAPALTSDVEEVSALAHRTSDLALEAAASKPRGDIYGKIVSTCSRCHQRLGVKPE